MIKFLRISSAFIASAALLACCTTLIGKVFVGLTESTDIDNVRILATHLILPIAAPVGVFLSERYFFKRNVMPLQVASATVLALLWTAIALSIFVAVSRIASSLIYLPALLTVTGAHFILDARNTPSGNEESTGQKTEISFSGVFKKNMLRIWFVPVVIYYIISMIAVRSLPLFTRWPGVNAEVLLTSVLFLLLLGTLYIVSVRYTQQTGKPIPRLYKGFWCLLLFLFAVYSLLFLIEFM